MSETPLLITLQTKVGELLEAYPELEAILIELAPTFKKLRNPILRRTVGKVTSLAQAARVGGVPVAEIVARLRREVGQSDFNPSEGDQSAVSDNASAPDWFNREEITHTFDARPTIDSGEQPVGRVLSDLKAMGAGEIYELITPFEPAPLVDLAKDRGFPAWTNKIAPEEFRTYFVVE